MLFIFGIVVACILGIVAFGGTIIMLYQRDSNSSRSSFTRTRIW